MKRLQLVRKKLLPLLLCVAVAGSQVPVMAADVEGFSDSAEGFNEEWSEDTQSQPAEAEDTTETAEENTTENTGILESGDMKLDRDGRRAYIQGREIGLTAKEFEVLELLMLNPDKVYGRENLLKLVWGTDYPGDVRTVDVHIRRLREKIESNPSEPRYVHTKWGVGYYFNNK